MEIQIATAAIACNQPLFRQGLISLLREKWPGWQFLDIDGPDKIDGAWLSARSTMLMIELDFLGRPGLPELQRLQARYPDLLVVVLGNAAESDIIWQCIAMGARAFLCKSASAAQFLQAVETVLADGIFAPASLSGTQCHAPLPADAAPAHTLDWDHPLPDAFTGRQREVFLLLLEGCSTKSIARRLGLSVGTVKVHLAGIYRLLGAHSRIEALARARSYATGLTIPFEQPRADTQPSSRFEPAWCAA